RDWDRLGGAALAAATGPGARGSARRASASQDEQTEAQSMGFNGTLRVSRPAPGQRAGTRPLAQRGTIPLQRFTLPSISAAYGQQPENALEEDDWTVAEVEGPPPATRTNGHGRLAPKAARALAQIEYLSEQLRVWIRREGMLGMGVLLCASLLGGLAGSLAPASTSASGSTPNVTAPTIVPTTKTPVDLTQTVDGLQVT